MPFDPNKHHRRSIRLKGYDYAQSGAYFVTLCTYNREPLFGRVRDGVILLSEDGRVVEESWRALCRHFTCVELDAFVVMPNHLHGLIVITDRREGEAFAAGEQGTGLGQMANASPLPQRPSGTKSGSPGATIDDRQDEAFADGEQGKGLGHMANASPPQQRPSGTMAGSLGAIIQNFKAVSSRKITIADERDPELLFGKETTSSTSSGAIRR